MSYRKIGLTTGALTQDLLSGMPWVLKIELIHLWNSILPEPGQPSAQLSKLICLTACKKAMHAISRWYRTVYIPWLVASYDTHKGKRWLNSNPANHRGKTLFHSFTIVAHKFSIAFMFGDRAGQNRHSISMCSPKHS